jgi:hypothetical protein
VCPAVPVPVAQTLGEAGGRSLSYGSSTSMRPQAVSATRDRVPDTAPVRRRGGSAAPGGPARTPRPVPWSAGRHDHMAMLERVYGEPVSTGSGYLPGGTG